MRWPRSGQVGRPAVCSARWPISARRLISTPSLPKGGILGVLGTLGTLPSAAPTAGIGGGSFPGHGQPAAPAMPGTWQALLQGARSATGQLEQTLHPGAPALPLEDSPAAEPLGWSDLASPSRIAPKVAYQFAQSYPMLAGGVVGGLIGGRVGGLAGPEGAAAGALIGGSLGTAAMSAAQTLGPSYVAELQKTPNDPEGAWSRAWRQAEISGAFSGASWAVFPARFFQGPVKQLVSQIFGVQPALAVGEKATRNIVDGRPVTEGLGEVYGQGVVGTAIPALGHGVVGSFLPQRASARRPELDRSSQDDATDGSAPAEKLRAKRAAQLKVNRAAGKAWENAIDAELDREVLDVAAQLTVAAPSGDRMRLDFATRNRMTGEFGCLECKSSPTAPVRPRQVKGFSEIENHGATVVGEGKPGFPGGMKIPPTRVEIRRPRK